MSGARIAKTIKEAGALAVETGDYISYATVLDLNLADLSNLSIEDAAVVVDALSTTLSQNKPLVEGVGWDIPELIMRFVDRYHEHMIESHGKDPMFAEMKKIAVLLCEEANPRELFVKVSEQMLVMPTLDYDESLESPFGSDDEDDAATPAAELDAAPPSVNEPVSPPPSSNSAATNPEANTAAASSAAASSPAAKRSLVRNTSSATPDMLSPFELQVVARMDDFKFNLLYEMMRCSLLRIKTDHPSRFFTSAATTMLTVASNPSIDAASVSTYARRMFVFGRDFEMAPEDVSDAEHAKTAELLRNYVSHAVNVSLEHVSIKWAQRLYYQLINKLATAPPQAREATYHQNLYTERITEVIARLSQLELSFDVNIESMVEAIGKKYEEIEAQPEDQKSEQSDDEGAYLGKISDGGLYLMATQIHFEGPRTDCPSLQDAAEQALYLAQTLPPSFGIRDATLYWALWVSVQATSEAVRKLPVELFNHYLHLLLSIAATSEGDDRHIAYSVVAKLLRLQAPDEAYEFLVDTLQDCPFDTVLDAAVQMLKTLVTGKTKHVLQEGTCRSSSNCGAAGQKLELNLAQKQQLARMAESAVEDVAAGSASSVPLLLSWMNLLTVVPTDKTIVARIYKRASELVSEDLLPETWSHLLKLSVESLHKAQLE